MLKELEINVSKMAAVLHYDASYISKIRKGKRAPSDPVLFAEDVCGYIVRNCFSEEERKKAASLTGGTVEDLEKQEIYFQTLAELALSGRFCKNGLYFQFFAEDG